MRARRRVTVVGASVVAPDAPTLDSPAEATDVYDGVAVAWTASVTAGQVPDAIQLVLDAGTGGETVVDTDTTSTYGGNWTPSGVTAGAHTLVARFVYGSGSVDSAAVNVVLYDPSVEANVVWLNANLGITKDGSDKVSQWDDQSGSGNDYVQATGSQQFKWFATGGQNGGAVVRVRATGNTECMDCAGLNTAQPFTVAALVKKNGVGITDRVFDGVAAADQAIIYSSDGTNIKSFAGTADVTSTETYSAGNWYRMIAVFAGASSVLSVNGTENTGNPGAGGWTAGARVGNKGGGTPNLALNGDIQHYLVFTGALDATARARLDAWMAVQ